MHFRREGATPLMDTIRSDSIITIKRTHSIVMWICRALNCKSGVFSILSLNQ